MFCLNFLWTDQRRENIYVSAIYKKWKQKWIEVKERTHSSSIYQSEFGTSRFFTDPKEMILSDFSSQLRKCGRLQLLSWLHWCLWQQNELFSFADRLKIPATVCEMKDIAFFWFLRKTFLNFWVFEKNLIEKKRKLKKIKNQLLKNRFDGFCSNINQ